MKIDEAIRKAILEGNYGNPQWKDWFDKDPHTEWTGLQFEMIFSREGLNRMFLDPSFWRALGKALGWDKRQWYYNTFTKGEESNDGWRVNWHRFIDHLAEGGTAETYFETLK